MRSCITYSVTSGTRVNYNYQTHVKYGVQSTSTRNTCALIKSVTLHSKLNQTEPKQCHMSETSTQIIITKTGFIKQSNDNVPFKASFSPSAYHWIWISGPEMVPLLGVGSSRITLLNAPIIKVTMSPSLLALRLCP